MKTKLFGKRIIVSILLICHCQQIRAEGMMEGLQAENVTGIKEQTETNEEENVGNKTLMIATTNMPELDITTLLADVQVDGRHAFINNQFVAEDEEPLTSLPASPPYHHLQHSSYAAAMDYDQKPVRNDPAVAQKLPLKPNLDDDMGQIDDYEDEETSDYVSENDSVPDSQESLLAGNDKDTQIQFTQQHEIYAPTYQNKLYDFSNYKAQTSAIPAGSYYNNNFIPNTNLNSGILHASKLGDKSFVQHLNAQTNSGKKHLQNTLQQQQQQHSLAKLQLSPTPQPSFSYQNFQTKQQVKEHYSKPHSTEPLKPLPGGIVKTSSDAEVQTTSPFSATSGHNKRFKTVSSSIQYVSTPLADLVFKYSIGLAKHSNSNSVKSSSGLLPGNPAEIKNYILQ